MRTADRNFVSMVSRSTIALAVSVVALSSSLHVMTRPHSSADVTRAAVRQALMQDPKMVVDAVQILRESDDLARRQASIGAVEALGDKLWSERDHVIGNPSARRTVVEFYDYQCQHCRALSGEIDAFLRSDENVRVVMRPLPVLGPQSLQAAKAALASGAQGRWRQMHDALMTMSLPLSDEAIQAAAREAGVDVERMLRDMEGDEVLQAISDSVDVARSLRIEGTPGFVARGSGVMMGYGNREIFAAFARQAADRGSQFR